VDLQLYKVSASGRINLGGLLAGVELAQAEKNDDGTVTISPVNIVPTARRTASTVQDVPLPGLDQGGDLTDGEGPWDADDTDS
jgi:hypothetical protein